MHADFISLTDHLFCLQELHGQSKAPVRGGGRAATMSPRIVLAALAVFAATCIGFCVLVYLTIVNPVGKVDVMIGPFPPGTASEIFLLHGNEKNPKVMKVYLTDVVSVLADPIPASSFISARHVFPLSIEYTFISVQWIDSPKYGVLTYTTSRTWNLWWISEGNVRRPSMRSYFSREGRRAAITLTQTDAVPVSQSEALRLLGESDQGGDGSTPGETRPGG